MVLPIHVYGEPVLRNKARPVEGDSDELQSLIDDMLETMHSAAGIGLAAPQIGRGIRLFVVDLTPMSDTLEEDDEVIPTQPMVFINPEILDEGEVDVEFEEGCLSIPDLREVVVRPELITVRFRNRSFETEELTASGLLSRVIQHEYDHLEGILFIDLISAFKRKLFQRRLKEMAKGIVEAEYPIFTGASVS